MLNNMRSFHSPLRMSAQTELTAIDFGPVAQAPEIVGLRRALNSMIFEAASDLPAVLTEEAHEILAAYSGSDGDFYRLFYVPVWSFLHWATTGGTLDTSVLDAGREAHGLALFIHLWDDHLCDGQLALDLLRLHLRTEAWGRFISTSRRLCQHVGLDPRLVDEYSATYLVALHCYKRIDTIEQYCRRFACQIAIWTLVPRLVGYAIGGLDTATALAQIVEHFAIAWRLVDDIQDVHIDLFTEKRSAVWLMLDGPGRHAWAECRLRSASRDVPNPEEWEALLARVRAPTCLAQIRRQIDWHLCQAMELAILEGWTGLAYEIEQCRISPGPQF